MYEYTQNNFQTLKVQKVASLINKNQQQKVTTKASTQKTKQKKTLKTFSTSNRSKQTVLSVKNRWFLVMDSLSRI